MVKTMSTESKKVGFTLIELLVVVAIIALLISILLPALSKAKENGRRAVCLSNLHHLGQAFQQYLQSNDDILPVAAQMPSVDGDDPDGEFYHPPIMDYLRPYARSDELYHCPSDTPGRTERDTDDPAKKGRSFWETERTSYEYNHVPSMLVDLRDEKGKVNVGDTIVKITPEPPHHFRRWLNKISDLFLMTEFDPFHGKRGNKEIRHTMYADFHVEEHRHFPFEVDPNSPWNK